MYGHFVHEAVIASQETQSGATVHMVNEKYDEGQIVSQVTVKITKNDTPETLADKVFKAECMLYPYTIDKLVTLGSLEKLKIDEKHQIWTLTYDE